MQTYDPIDGIRIWAGMAWCDASLSSTERSALEQLITSSQVLDAAQRSIALDLLKPPVNGSISTRQSLDAAERLANVDPMLREELCHAALLLALLDGRLSAAEKAFLQRLRVTLRLPEEPPDVNAASQSASRSASSSIGQDAT